MPADVPHHRGAPAVAPFAPSGYPGPRPDTAVLVHRGRVVPVDVHGSAAAPVCDHLDAPVLEPGAVRWSLAYGSNASPPRLVAKGLDRRGALLLPAVATGWAAAYEGRRTRYGAVPVTLVPGADAVLESWVLGVHRDDTVMLDHSEGRVRPGAGPGSGACPGGMVRDDEVAAPPGAYVLAVVGEVAVASRFLLPSAVAYVPGPTTTVQLAGPGYRTWPAFDQLSALAHLKAERPTRRAPRAAEPVTGPWPATPLGDLPLFVYGSLQPSQPAWEVVADLVQVVGPAAARGRLHDSGRGWPAAVFGCHGAIAGTLVAPRDEAAAVELVQLAAAYEGAPGLFERTTVRVVCRDRPVWAMAYAWADEDTPGPVVRGGRWG